MPLISLRTALLGCAIVLTTATPGLAENSTEKPSVAVKTEAGAEPKPAPVKAVPASLATSLTCETCPPPINRKGGTAIINFVAPVTAQTMAELASTAQNAVISGADSIRINISSSGGSVHAMQFAVNVLRNLSVPVETVAMSQIASAAVALYCAGEKRYMAYGSGLYLHQQRGFQEIQDKTAAAVVREYELDKLWYDGLLRECTDADVDRTVLDYSARDVVIDVDQATALGMVTSPLSDLKGTKTWGLVINVAAPVVPGAGGGYPFPSFR